MVDERFDLAMVRFLEAAFFGFGLAFFRVDLARFFFGAAFFLVALARFDAAFFRVDLARDFFEAVFFFFAVFFFVEDLLVDDLDPADAALFAALRALASLTTAAASLRPKPNLLLCPFES